MQPSSGTGQTPTGGVATGGGGTAGTSVKGLGNSFEMPMLSSAALDHSSGYPGDPERTWTQSWA